MKKLSIITLLFVCMAAVVPLNAQPQTVRTVSSAGVTSADGNLSAIIGIPFAGQALLGDYEVSSGVAQAQIVYDSAYEVITYNTPYVANNPSHPEYNINLAPQTESHVEEIYFLNGSRYHYDSVLKLFLIVCPEKVADAYNPAIQYDALAVSGHCWTKQNLRSPIEGAMAYSSALYPTVPEVYGLLYTWNAAVNANATGFTAYPAGFYNSATQRFEGLCSQTDWWTMVIAGSGSGGSLLKTSMELACHCGELLFITRTPDDAVSVRCVMKNEWPE